MGYKLKFDKSIEEHEALKLLSSKIMRIPYDFKEADNGTTDAVFSFSNEDLNELFKNRRLKNKRVATVGSSGDQVLYSILHGCKDITCMDANPFTLPYLELKLSVIKNLSYEEFLDYFRYENILSHKYYSKISHDLSDYSKRFWDEILLNTDSSVSCYLQMVLFKIFQSVSTYGDFTSTRDAMEYCNNKKQYNNLKKALEDDINIEFIQSSFDEFHEKLKGRYDLILLSNICDYVDREAFLNEVRKLKYFKLNPFGEMQVLYDFNNGLMIPLLKEDLDKMFLFRKVRVKPCKDVRPHDYWHHGKSERGKSEGSCNIVYL